MVFAEGAVVGEYTLQRKVGQGPLAEVWRAAKADRPEPMALKILKPGALPPSAMRRAFERLVAALSQAGRLDNPHVPPAVGTVRRPSDGLFGIACPYHDGGPLLDAGDLTDPAALNDALELVIQLAQTVTWLHDQGIVHGAIKPTNVLASPTADGPSVKLLDLCWSIAGLCRLDGTRFAPPELERGPATPASDQWAIARLVRGLVARRTPEPVRAWAQIPADLRRAIDRSLSEDPAERFARTADLVDALVAARKGLSSSAPTHPAPNDLPAPTVPLPKSRPPSFEITTTDPVEDDERPPSAGDTIATPDAAGDAPTEPAMTESARARIRELAVAARTIDVASRNAQEPNAQTPKAQTPKAQTVSSIDPSADSSPPSKVARPPPRPTDPTDSLPPARDDGPRGLGLPFIVAAAAVIAIALYAWSVAPLADSTRESSVARRAPATSDFIESDSPPPLPLVPPDPPASRQTDRTHALPTPSGRAASKKSTAPASSAAERPATGAGSEAGRSGSAGPGPGNRTIPARAELSKKIDVEAKDHAWGECRGGLLTACKALAKQHERLKHWRAAAKSREQACRLGDKGSCLLAGDHFVKAGQGRSARRRYEKLCDNRTAVACAKLADLYFRGIGGAANARTGRAFVKRACRLGHRPSCQ